MKRVCERMIGSLGLAALLLAIAISPAYADTGVVGPTNNCTPSGDPAVPDGTNGCKCGGSCVQGTESWQCVKYVKTIVVNGEDEDVCACSCGDA